MAAVGATAWVFGELMSGFPYRHILTPYLNGLMLLVFFLVAVYLLSAFQQAHYHLEETVLRRTAALEVEIQQRKRLEGAKLQAERLALVGTMVIPRWPMKSVIPLGSMTLNLDLIKEGNLTKLAEGKRHSAGRRLRTGGRNPRGVFNASRTCSRNTCNLPVCQSRNCGRWPRMNSWLTNWISWRANSNAQAQSCTRISTRP